MSKIFEKIKIFIKIGWSKEQVDGGQIELVASYESIKEEEKKVGGVAGSRNTHRERVGRLFL